MGISYKCHGMLGNPGRFSIQGRAESTGPTRIIQSRSHVPNKEGIYLPTKAAGLLHPLQGTDSSWREHDMAEFSIRRYKSSDYDTVRLIFAQGMMEQLPATSFYLLKLPQIQVLLFIPFITLYLLSKSYTFSFGSLALLMATGWYGMKSIFSQYVNKCHRADLLDIEKSYMMANNSCFWVAESEGRVIGMVGIQPTQDSKDAMVLRRLSVASEQRVRGIGKALCMKAIDFARQRGYRRVNLDTSMIQRAAHRLYEGMGFEKTNVKIAPGITTRFTNFSVFYYTYWIE
ncbi:hypothetical protein XENTR_v10000190 [Xenopus tropicalis]|uniref:Uncharacterized protein LOC100145252 isoform X1 n=2 Tax=Xenopus tropicalis TaxID=8364 RepID=A0A8J0SD32_XENTR|nr:uncharacterized protein LOC100145252 isoform X1 [Xenopus tropicalis]KAE8628712.1 hypothetical protein XENTR_v10000190 [Xenopus tropicalis]